MKDRGSGFLFDWVFRREKYYLGEKLEISSIEKRELRNCLSAMEVRVVFYSSLSSRASERPMPLVGNRLIAASLCLKMAVFG